MRPASAAAAADPDGDRGQQAAKSTRIVPRHAGRRWAIISTMLQKKICMLGGFGVGKTSLVSRFVSSMFSDKYLTTVGVKVDKKTVPIDSGEMTLMLWDIYGQDEFQTVRDSYLRGASGYLLVADGTRSRDARYRDGATAEGRVGQSDASRSCSC